MMNKITLNVKVMSCKGLKAFNFFQKLLVYALVSLQISNDAKEEEEVQQKHRTQRDEEGDGDPEWNQEMQFDVDEDLYRNHSDRLLIHFEFRHEGIMFGDKVIGEVRVPLKDLIQDAFSSDGVARFVSYEVRSTDGKPNGVLNFSYGLFNPIPKLQSHLPCTTSYSYSSSTSSNSNVSVTGYPTSPRVQYPSLEEVEVELQQQVPQSWPTQYHYPPPPPPPPPHVVGGAYFYPLPPPPQVHYWPPQDTWSSSSSGEPHALGNEAMWPTPTLSGHHHNWSPFWNGR